MKTKSPEIRLISCTRDPIETLFACWAQSRPTQYPKLFEFLRRTADSNVVTAIDVIDAVDEGVLQKKDINEVFQNIISTSLPVSESVHLTWGFCALPIEWREQAVRKRQWGFWLTSMREFGMDDFVTDGRWTPPVDGSLPPEARAFLEDFMVTVESAYRKLKELGAPQEIARKVIPLCASHNGTMFSNLRTLIDTLSSRSCWIAQIDLWGPVLLGMILALREVHPLLGSIISPPCFERYKDSYKGCKYAMINTNRLNKKDPYAVCPLYFVNEFGGEVQNWSSHMTRCGTEQSYIEQGARLLTVWRNIWNRDQFTGKLL